MTNEHKTVYNNISEISKGYLTLKINLNLFINLLILFKY